jgi:hypothetical protein
VGGGIHMQNSSSTLSQVAISNNLATKGGGIYMFGANSTLNYVIISNNTGGGMYLMNNSSPTLTHVSIINNSMEETGYGGGGIYCQASSPLLNNVTISNNLSDASGGGIYLVWSCNITLKNSIIWNNIPESIYSTSGSTNLPRIITYSNIEGGWEGDGNINENPLFVDAENDNFNLMEDSPCIESGSVLGIENSEYCGNYPDMGAFEYSLGYEDTECGICGGLGSMPEGACDCAGNIIDECGICGSDNSACLDECGIPNGDNSTCLDECGVPNGDNSTCTGCTDEEAWNYDLEALVEGGMCIYFDSNALNLFISEYIEGSGQTRAIELYNPTNSPINLLGFELWVINNGGDWIEGSEYNYIYPEYELNPGEVFVFCGSDFSGECDFIENLPFGGDDAAGLVYDGTVIDQVGSEGDDPGSGWMVAGIEDATKNHTLVRHPDVLSGDMNWENSAMNGWVVYDQNVTEYLGHHEVSDSSVMAGDTNFDGIVDILDIVRIVNHIMGNSEFNDDEFTAADFNADGIIDILDIVQIVNYILAN